MVMSNRRQKGQDLIEYALLLALVVAVGIYVYVHGGLTDSLKQIYGSASSVVDIINGEHGGEDPGDNPSEHPEDQHTGKVLADSLKEAIANGYTDGDSKKFPYISFFGGLSDQNGDSWVEVAVVRNPDGTFSVYNNGNSSGYGARGVFINNKRAGDFSGLWSQVINQGSSGINSGNVTIADDSTAWYGVRVRADGQASYYSATIDNPSTITKNGKTIPDFNSSDVTKTPLY